MLILAQQYFSDNYEQWIELYKRGEVRDVTSPKYLNTLFYIRKITSDSTRKVVVKGTVLSVLTKKFLHQHEMTALLAQLQLDDKLNTDYLVLLIAKTGFRISGELGLTP